MRAHLATLVRDFQRYDREIAVVTYPGNQRRVTTYRELALLAGRFSRLLMKRAIDPGERVLLWGANSAEWVAAFFGCVLRGVIVVPLDVSGSVEFAMRVVADVSPRLIVGDTDRLQQISKLTPVLLFQEFDSALPSEPMFEPEPSLTRETPLQILFTSGTTSTPKGVVHTHGNVLASLDVLEREIQKYLRYERWVHPIRILHTLPLSHVFGQFMGLWIAPLLASPVHYEDKLVASALVERIHEERLSIAVVVPRVLELMRVYLVAVDPTLPKRLENVRKQKIWWRWWHLRDVHRRFGFKFWAFVSGGATLPQDLEQFWNTLGFVLIQGYGMTETTALATLNHPFRTAQGTIGKPLEGREVRVAEDGEILVRGDMLAAGMWRNGQMEPRAGEWLHTGDLGSVDPSGDVRFLGRKSDVIVAASGMNIHPADLEAAVQHQAGVRECVVVGWNGPRGPEPIAVVRLDANIAPGNEKDKLQQILTTANQNLQEFQQIRSILRWPGTEFPRTSTGKLVRRQVAEWVQLQLQAKSTGPVLSSHHDSLLRLLEQVTGESANGLNDSDELTTAMHLDSLGRMQLAMGMEEQFGVAVNDDAIGAAKTLGDLRKLLLSPQESLSNTPHLIDSVSQNNSDRHETELPDASLPISISKSPRTISNIPRYVRWPWSGPIQALRVIFLECVLRPLVALLAHPRVVTDAVELPKQPSIYICNHVTAIDVALVLFALPGHVRRHMAVAMSAELLDAWQRGWPGAGVGAGPLRWLAPLQAQLIIALFNVFPLPAGAGLRQSFAHAGKALDRGYNVLIFPEGRRTRTGEMQPFQTGISLLAQESDTAIVPMALAGLWQAAQNRGLLSWLRPRGLAVVIGNPIRRNSRDSHIQFAENLHEIVRHLISIGMESK